MERHSPQFTNELHFISTFATSYRCLPHQTSRHFPFHRATAIIDNKEDKNVRRIDKFSFPSPVNSGSNRQAINNRTVP